MNELIFQGRLAEILPVQSGTSKAGKDWKSIDFILESEGQYPKQVAFSLFGDKIDYITKYTIGTLIDVKFSLESRIFNGKAYTKASAYSVSPAQSSGSQTTGSPNNYSSAVHPSGLPPSEYATQPQIVDEVEENLPF